MARVATTLWRSLHNVWAEAALIFRAASRSSVAKNAASLYVIQFANYMLPLVTVPYLVRVLGPASYGTVAFGQSFIAYFALLVDYGFNLSATRRISVSRTDLAAVSRIACSVWSAKALLGLAGLGLLLTLTSLVPRLREAGLLLLILYGGVIGNVLFPTWLFQGMERMVFISIANLLARCLVVVGVFALIRTPQDYLLYAALTSFGSVAAGLIGAGLGLRMLEFKAAFPSWQGVREALAEGWAIFLSQASISLYTSGNAFILGLLTTPVVVGYYSAAEKIVKAVLGLLGPISQTAYPMFSRLASRSRDEALLWGKRMLYAMSAGGFVLSLLLFAGAPWVVRIVLGSSYGPSVGVMRVLAFLCFAIATNNVLGIQLMLGLGHDRAFMLTVFSAGMVNVLMALTLVPIWDAIGMAVGVLLTELFIVGVELAFLHRRYSFNPLLGRVSG